MHATHPPQCSVCKKALTPWQILAEQKNHTTAHNSAHALKPLPYHCCGSFECSNILAKVSTMSTPQFASYLSFHSQNIIARETNAKREAERLAAQRREEDEENQTTYQHYLQNNENLNRLSHPLLVIPSSSAPLIPLEEDRKKNFTELLQNLIAQASEDGFTFSDEHKINEKKCQDNNAYLAASTALSSINNQACTLCKGGCCTQGYDHAYLTAATLYRFMQSENVHSPAMVMEEYLGRLPEKSVAGSCLFHTQSGCALTREMRSDVCNGYLCDNLKNFNQQFSGHTNEENGRSGAGEPQENINKSATRDSCPSNKGVVVKGAIIKGAVVISRALDNWRNQNHSGNNQIIKTVVIEPSEPGSEKT